MAARALLGETPHGESGWRRDPPIGMPGFPVPGPAGWLLEIPKAVFTLGVAQELLADGRGGNLGAALASAAEPSACGVGTPSDSSRRRHLLRPANWKPAACPTLASSQALVIALGFTSALFSLAG